ncbi:MAG TPA: FtsX-like permease family protein, partial [Pseudonocardiaceae bacterium]
ARAAVPADDAAGAPLLVERRPVYFRGEQVRTYVVRPEPGAPIPPGLTAWPADGQMVVSPALERLLASADGELLAPRLPWAVAGTVGDAGLVSPGELLAYAVADVSADAEPAAGWGTGPGDGPPIELVLLALAGSVVVLIPVVVLVAAATRVAAAVRERRLAALRLIGADAGQARRLASGEALVGAVGGVLVGLVLFLIGRGYAAQVSLLGLTVFPSDLTPGRVPFALIVLAVPAIAVLAAVVALRHVVAQPLGLARRSAPPRRRLWWRLVPLIVGLGLLASQAGEFAGNPGALTIGLVLGGLALTGFAVPTLLPWLVQRAVDPLSGGPPSWQLAVRRIQLDSGTPARAAGGLAAMLTAAVAFQTLLASAFANDTDWDAIRVGDQQGRLVDLRGGPDVAPDDLAAAMAGVAGVRHLRVYQEVNGNLGDADGEYVGLRIAPCAVLATYAAISDCADGDVFATDPYRGEPVSAGDRAHLRRHDEPGGAGPTWVLPPSTRPVGPVTANTFDLAPGTVLVTPGAIAGVDLRGIAFGNGSVLVDPGGDVAEHVANAMPAVGPHAVAYSYFGGDATMRQLRDALLAGAAIVLVLAAAGLLIVSVEQVRERRRQIAALAASGVGTRTLAASVLWQATVPFAVATVASLGVGTGTGLLLMRVFDVPGVLDWAGMGTVVVASTLAVVTVTVLTMPALRAAARPEGLRTE